MSRGTTPLRAFVPVTLALALATLVSGCAGVGLPDDGPPGFIRGEILHTYYDGKTNDLLTGGLGSAGLANANPPPFANPVQPTAVELRTRAIHANYRALVDMTPEAQPSPHFILWQKSQ